VEALLEAVRLRLRQLRSRMRGVKKAADDTTLGASARQTKVRQCCSKLMQAIEARQHVMLEAVTCTQEAKLDQLQRQANRIDTEAQQLLQTEKELQHAHAMGTSERPSAGLLESMHVSPFRTPSLLAVSGRYPWIAAATQGYPTDSDRGGVGLPPQRSARLLPQDEEEDAREGEATRPCLPAETQHTQLCV
jgi:hypothetical protein